MVSQCTKLEVFRFTRYEAMNGGAKCRKWGGLGQLGGHSFDRAHMTSYSTLIETMRLSYRFRDIADYLSKVDDFDPPRLHSTPPYGVTPVEFRGDLWQQKTRIHGLSYGVVCVILE